MGQWLGVRLQGSTAGVVGTRVAVATSAGLDTRFVGADVSFTSGHSSEQLFGLGADVKADLTVSRLGGRSLKLLSVPGGRRVVISSDWGH